MMKRIFLIAIAFFCLMAPGVGRAQDEGTTPQTGLAHEDLVLQDKAGVVHHFSVELALSPMQQMRGLMFRKHMDDDAGMLFVFPIEDNQSFWMKDTLIPLDMLFIRRNGTIGHIHENAVPQDLTPVDSQGRVMAVLELNGGTTRKLKIAEGDQVLDQIYFKPTPASH